MPPSPLLARALAPTRLAGLNLRNRVIKTATYEGRTPSGVPGTALTEFHRQVAAGGAALTTVAYCGVSADARTFADQMHMHEAVMPQLASLAAAVHAEGGAVSGQLAHCGGFSRIPGTAQPRPMGPVGGINEYGLFSGVPFKSAMREADIQRTVADYANAARLLQQAGFDALEIHMGHGYLLSQFISPFSNRRTDRYGGSLENRMRFPLQVLAAVRRAVGDDFPLLAKINLADGLRGGLQTDEAVRTTQMLEAGGIDAIVMSGGLVTRTPMYLFRGGSPLPGMIATERNPLMRWSLRMVGKQSFPEMPFKPLYFREQALRVREAIKHSQLAYLGGVTSAADIEQVMDDGFDLVTIGRALMHDAAMVRKLASDSGYVSRCSHCNECVSAMNLPQGSHCTQLKPA